METKIITKADLNYRNEYAASTDLRFAGHLTFEADLGWVRILGTLAVDGCIVAKAGSSIEAGSNIKAGFAIEAGSSIKAGEGIEAGSNIKAGEGIEAGFAIVAKAVTCKLRIFAGLCLYRLPKPEEGQIRVTRPVQGTVCFGEVVVEPVKAKG